MRRFQLNEMTGGWFIGDFSPSAFRTAQFEVSLKVHPKGEVWPAHFHKIATEINLVVSGRMTLQGELLSAGDIFILDPHEVADPLFHEDCSIVCVKVPSVIGDKFPAPTAQ